MTTEIKDKESDSIKRLLFLALFVIIFIAPYLIQEHTRGADSWGNWFFARLIWETGTFPVLGRSPIYGVFSAIFLPLGYPFGPLVTRFLDSLFLFFGMFALFRCHMKFYLSAFAAVIWLPGLLSVEGIVKALAVASLCWALALRHGPVTRSRIMLSYAFLILSFLFRVNYIVALLGFVFYDAIRFAYSKNLSQVLFNLRPKRQDWPVALLLGLFMLFVVMQSHHRWNNAYFTDIKWFGPDQRSIATAAEIGALAQWIIVNKYDSNFDDHDIYFIAKNDLPEFHSIFDLYKYPEILFGQIYSNKQMISIVSRITDLGDVLFKVAARFGSHIYSYPIFYAFFVAGLFQFYRHYVASDQRRQFWEMISAVGVITAPLFIAWPSGTYYFHFVPLFVFVAVGLGHGLSERIGSILRSGPFLKFSVSVIPLILFSNLISQSVQTFADSGTLTAWQRPHLIKEVFEGQFEKIDALTSSCRGTLLTGEYSAMAAFSKQPIDKFYSITEIPPFGKYGDPEYSGLTPDRIDCIVVQKSSVRRGLNTFTTKWSRYENYIVPYIAVLKKLGAKTYTYGAEGQFEVTVTPAPQ